MKKALTAFLLLLTVCVAHAQKKVFQEVGEDIQSQVKAIYQDNSLVGYVVFTQLEKASADSFNYKITIMDENLNDIGSIKFREIKLDLQSVAFEQDVLCLGYLKSNFVNKEFKNNKEYHKAFHTAQSYIYTQFLSLDGKILASNTVKADVKPGFDPPYGGKPVGQGHLKHEIIIKNIAQKGFACLYGEENTSNLLIYNPAGKQIWQKPIPDDVQAFYMLTSHTDVYILEKKKDKMTEGGYELIGFNTADNSLLPRYTLQDKDGDPLKIIAFENDPATGRPYLAGQIINPHHGNSFANINQLSRGTYAGLFCIDINGHKKNEIHETFFNWANGSHLATVSKKGHFTQDGTFCRFEEAFKDYDGNIYFSGSAAVHKMKWVSLGLIAATAPFILPPFIIDYATGVQKGRLQDGMLVRLTPKGALSLENSIPLKATRYIRGAAYLSFFDYRNYHHLNNTDTKTNYLIVDDAMHNIIIYNVNQKKIARTIPHKDGNIHTTIFPAKEGHFIVSEYNKKDGSTSLSIEAL